MLFRSKEVLQQLSHPGLQHSYCLKDPLKPRSTLTSDPQTTFTLILSIDLHFLDISYDRDHTRYSAWLLLLSTMLWRFIHVINARGGQSSETSCVLAVATAGTGQWCSA